MDVPEARSVLGIADTDDWAAVRAAYRRLIRAAHPDTAGRGATRRAAQLNEAYAVLSRAKRSGTLTGHRTAPATSARRGGGAGQQPPGRTTGGGRPTATGRTDGRRAGGPSSGGAPAAPAPPAAGVTVTGGDTLLLAAPPQVAFAWLLEAAHRLGAVSYVDRSCGVFEVIVRLDDEGRVAADPRTGHRPQDGVGETCSLLVMLEPRAHGSEAVLAVESLERAASRPPEPLLRRLTALLG